jgi:hypothetical protein
MSGRNVVASKASRPVPKRSQIVLSKENILPRSFTAKGREVKVEVVRGGRKRALPIKLVEVSPGKKFGDQINSPKKQVMYYNQIRRALKFEGIKIPLVTTLRLSHSMAGVDSVLVTKLDIVSKRDLAKLSRVERKSYHTKLVTVSKILGKMGWSVPMGSFVPVRNASGKVDPVLADFKNIIKL